MSHRYLELATTPSVAAVQQRYYGHAQAVAGAPPRDSLGETERAFIAGRDSFYLATVSETGWPYLQHRGGPAGFLRVLDAHTLAFADVRGNRQMLTTGNLAVNDRVALFLMSYAQRSRLKIMGRARVFPVADRPDLVAAVAERGLPSPERVMLIDVLGFDWNCPKHITVRYTAAEVEELVSPLRKRIAQLEAQLRSATKPAV
jgi:predicted pyridoxine 5'-phosphate oxidase superfamily flavin-nucleotide-binding protein